MSDPERILAHLLPLRWLLYSYMADSDINNAISGILGITGNPRKEEAWSAYIAEKDALNTPDHGFPALRRLLDVVKPDPFMDFCVLLALSAEMIPAHRAVLDSMGGLTPALALRLFSSSLDEAVRWQSLWRQREATVRLLFASTDMEKVLTLRPVVSGFLLGAACLPEHCVLYQPGGALPEPVYPCGVPQFIVSHLAAKAEKNLFVITGVKGSGRKYQLLRFAEKAGHSLLFLHYGDISNERAWLADIEVFITLTGSILCITGMSDSGQTDKADALLRSVRPANMFILGENNTPTMAADGYSLVPLHIPVPGYTERLKMHKEGALRISHRLDQMAMNVRSGYTWDDLILPPRQKRLLSHILDRSLYGDTVYRRWGMDAGAAYGRGVCALFSGPPGTGKTMAAQIIANELGMDIYTVNLSTLVSKYIGETEKNLEAVFAEAEKCCGILFFDEADALFGRRGEQKDSHDKYANMQASFLLQRFETYDGIALLATNLISNLDPAFLRRIQIRVEFPPPDRDLRLKIWEKQLKGGSAPLSDNIDLQYLAEAFELTGSAIRSIALTAAFMAAAENESIGMRELIEALVIEYAKMDKVITAREFGEYAEFTVS